MISIKKIKTKKNNYIYDVFNNQILKVDNSVFDLFDENINFEEINLDKLDEDKRERIIDLHRKGYFSKFPLKIDSFNSEFNGKIENLENLTLNITENCNFRCKYCLYGDEYNHLRFRKHSQKKMSFDVAKKAIDYFFKHCIMKNPTITFFGGEPLLEYNFIEIIINYINVNYFQFKVIYQIATNASLLTNKMLNFFKKNNVLLDISIDGPASIHNKNRIDINKNKTFDNVFSKIKIIKNTFPTYFNSNIRFYITYNLSIPFQYLVSFLSNNSELFPIKKLILNEIRENKAFYNKDEELKSYKYIKKNLDKAFENVFNNHKLKTTLKNDSVELPKLNYEDEFLFKFATMSLTRIHNLINKKLIIHKKIHPNGCCVPGKANLSVSTYGDYHYCSQLNWSQSTIIGNVNDGIAVDKIHNIIKSYEEISLENCKNCWAINLCRICFSAIHDGHSLSKKQKDHICIAQRKYLYDDLVTYCELMEKDKTILEYLYDN